MARATAAKAADILPALAPATLETLDPALIEEPEESPADRVVALLRESKGSDRATVNIYRVGPEEKLIFLRSMKPDEFESAGSFDFIRKHYGGGEFEVRLYDISPTNGKFSVRAKPRVMIEDSRIPEEKPAGDAVQGALLEKLFARLDAIEQRQQNPNADPFTSLERAFVLMAKMREATGFNPAPAAPATNPLQVVRETLAAVKEIREEIDAPEAPPADSLTALAKPLLEMLQRAQGNAPQIMPGAQAEMPQLATLPTVALPLSMVPPVAPAPAPAPVAAPSADNPEPFEMRLWNLFLDELMRRAARNADVSETADLFYDHAPEDAIALLKMDIWLDALAEQRPQAREFVPWFEQVRAAVLKLVAEDESESV